MLMRMLHDTQAFCSLTYRDMPFVLAPNTWARLTGLSRRDVAARERAHGDGIIVDVDSPEALEEVFWGVFCGPAYIGPETLRPMEADDDVLEQFRRYVAIILKRYQADRYLSKNNNNLLRLPSLRGRFRTRCCSCVQGSDAARAVPARTAPAVCHAAKRRPVRAHLHDLARPP